MSTPIGRAGRQVFSNNEHDQARREKSSPRISEPASAAPSPVPTVRLPPSKPKPPVVRERRDSEDSLENTLAQCMQLEPVKSQPLSPYREVIPLSSKIDKPSPPAPSFGRPVPSPMNTTAYLSQSPMAKRLAEESISLAGMDGSRKIADLEKQELLAALEVLKMQNQMLSNRIEKNQHESKLQVEYERQERMLAISALERENKDLLNKLVDAKERAEKQLREEKEAFSNTLALLEAEKDDLQVRLDSIQIQSAQAIEQLSLEHSKMEKDILKLECDKQDMYSKVLQIEALNDSAILESELANLRSHIQQVELEKTNLHLQMQYNEQQMTEQNNKLNERLMEERQAAEQRVQVIEAQRNEVSSRLEEASKQREAVDEQLQRVQATHSQHQLVANGPSSVASSAEKKVAVKVEAKKKAKALQERLKARKKDRLTASVTKMRASFDQEKSQQSSNNSSMNDMNSVNQSIDSNNPESIAGKKVLAATRSLFDMMSLGNPTAAIGMSAGKDGERYDMMPNLPHKVRAVSISKPVDVPSSSGAVGTMNASKAGKTIMDLDSSDEEDDGDQLKPITKAKQKASPSSVADDEHHQSGGVNKPSSDDINDLPEGHAAAARGDLPRLKELLSKDPSLLDSMDVSSRYIIFYAAVHGYFNIIIYLLQLYTINVMDIYNSDVFGDTILHAAVCSNNVVCLDMLLGKLDKIYDNPVERLAVINHRNSYGMTAAHMAGNMSCLELLHKHGADMAAVDAQSRTPLFIFCLLNNEKCVNFLINSNDSIEYLYKADYRGDTPLHAAACNGSVECLLTLLQQGIDPRMVNAQNLRAVDLAIRNKQNKCRDILAEYLLHYSTNSDFDSVLFLAALEGHRYIAQNAHKMPAAGTTGTSPLPRMLNKDHIYPSLFTLRDAKTMRLQRFGSWLAYHDPYTAQVFWYNHETCSGQWELPEQVLQFQQQAERARQRELGNVQEGEEDRFDKVLQSKLSMRMKRRGDWIEYATVGCAAIFYNDKDGSFQWEDPFNPGSQPAQSASYEEYNISHEGHGIAHYQHDEGGWDYEEEEEAYDEAEQGAGGEWHPYVDDATGSVYWYNTLTAESQWENPYGEEHGGVLQQAVSNSSHHGYDQYDDEHHEQVEVVNSLHELGF